MKEIRSKNHSLEKIKARYGIMFCIPWIIGFILFILIPIGQSILFSFSKVTMTADGLKLDFKGLKYFKYILAEEPTYGDKIISSLGDFAYSLPFIVIFSLIIAVILNGKFKGRVLFRSVFFLPAIISTGIVMSFISEDSLATAMMDTTDKVSAFMGGFIDFKAVMMGLGLPENVTTVIITYIDKIFNLLWSCGIQIVIFVSGLQTVPRQLYEVCKVEGATQWETFWYLTFPMLGSTLLLVIIYTSIDILTGTSNTVMRSAFNMMQQQVYDVSSAMLWAYFISIFAIIALLIAALYFWLLKKWEG